MLAPDREIGLFWNSLVSGKGIGSSLAAGEAGVIRLHPTYMPYKKMSFTKTLTAILIFVIILIFAETETLVADIAPPDSPPGGNLNPSQQTFVQMVSEEVIIDIPMVLSPDISNYVHVNAYFEMYNHGDEEEIMLVRFPMSEPSGYDNGYGGYPTIESITVQVNGEFVPTAIITSTNPLSADDPDISWAAFDVAFPSKETVGINVNYIARPSIYYPFAQIGYIFETGAGWYDVINSVDMIVRLPFEVEQSFFDRYTQPAGGLIQGKEIRWHWDNLEPTTDDNFQLGILYPTVWQTILTYESYLASDPSDILSTLILADLYLELASEKHGFIVREHFADRSLEIVENALLYHPESADLHSSLAHILFRQMLPNNIDLSSTNGQRILNAIETARELDPLNKRLDNAAIWIDYRTNFSLGWVATPTVPPTIAPTSVPTKTPTPKPSPTATSTPTPVEITKSVPTETPVQKSTPTSHITPPQTSWQASWWYIPIIMLLLMVYFYVRSTRN